MHILASFIDGVIVVLMGVVISMAFMWWVGEENAHANARRRSVCASA